MSTHSILLVDDDSDVLITLSRALGQRLNKISIEAAPSSFRALSIATRVRPEAAIIDLSIEPERGVESGFELLHKLLEHDATCRVIVLTGHGSLEYGVRAMNLGAAHFLEKPADIDHLAALTRDAIAQCGLRRAYSELKKNSPSKLVESFCGSSAQTEATLEAIRYAAQNNQSVLIAGETGTGKGLCAQLIHEISPRSASRFVRYQPNFSTADLINSDLFGHVRGSFTGANEDRRGLMAEADRGTLFLDEIDELPSETQVAMLGVLQDRTYRPVGSNRELHTEFRLIAASNQDIGACLESGKLRRDFYHRIAHLTIHIPPLRERPLDIPDLARHFLGKIRARELLSVWEIDSGAIALLSSYNWPGNVRELQSVVEGAAWHAQYQCRAAIHETDIKLNFPSSSTPCDTSFHDQVTAFKVRLAQETVAQNGGNQMQAARKLGIDRSSLRRILAKQG